MSGYRSLHREQILGKDTAIWSVQATPLLTKTKTTTTAWRIWTASSDGFVRSYTATESSIQDDALDASALTLSCTHLLLGQTQQQQNADGASACAGTNPSDADDVDGPAPAPVSALGCTRVCTVRNYVGDDATAGDLVVVSLGLSGVCRVWKFAADWDAENNQGNPSSGISDATSTANTIPTITIKPVKCLTEFNTVKNATGTTMAPRVVASMQQVVIALGCLDGTIAIVATGIATPNASKEAAIAGTILDTWGSSGSATPVSLAWHPVHAETLVVGRQDGVLDILSSTKRNQHKLLRLNTSPARAVAYTPDGNLLVAGNDAGMLCVWDVGRGATTAPVLVHHVLQAHKSWMLDLCTLADSRRFVTVGAERQMHVWSVGQLTQPLHTFQLDGSVWTVSLLRNNSNELVSPRMVTGSDTGWLQVFSMAS